jgi:hypothetical protein
MSKHHLQNLAEQIGNKGYASAPFHYGKEPVQEIEAVKSEDIQLRAYQIHLEKGGSDIDNWLEAERSLKHA